MIKEIKELMGKLINKKVLLPIAAGLLLLPPVTGETRSLEEILLLARGSSPDLISAQNDYNMAKNDLTGIFRLDETSLTARGEWEITEEETATSNPVVGSLSLTIPVIDQLSFSASLDSDQNISAGATLRPLNLTSTTLNSRVDYENAQAALTTEESQLEWEILGLVLDLELARRNSELYNDLEELENQLYQASYALYLAGDYTYDDLLTAMDDLNEAEENKLDADKSLNAANHDLWLAIGVNSNDELASLSYETVRNLALDLSDRALTLNGDGSVTESIVRARNSLLQAQQDLDNTLAIHPDISLAADVSGSLEGETVTPKSSLTLTVTLSSSSFNFKEREELKAESAEKEQELNQAIFENELNRESYLSALEQALVALESAKRDLERNEILHNETEILFAQGERTILEQKEVALGLVESQNKLFQRAAELIQASTDYLTLFSEERVNILELL